MVRALSQVRLGPGEHHRRPLPAPVDLLAADTYWLKIRHSGKVANVSGASTANGGLVIQYPQQYAVNEYVKWTRA